jgi:SAM-dependent methyltransferase
MNREWIAKLVCPFCRKSLILRGKTLLFCENCSNYWKVLPNGIPVFIQKDIQQFWDAVTTKREHIYNKPLQINEYYCKFVGNNWGTMLDLGCGDAISAAPLSDKVKEIYCVDPSPLALERVLRRKLDNLYPILAISDKLPFPSNFFDGVFSIFVIEHTKNAERMLNEIHRVLKPNGELVISTDSKYYYKYLRFPLGWVRGNFNVRKNDPTHVNLMTPKQMRHLLRETNFKIELDDSHFFISEGMRKRMPQSLSDTFLSTTIIYKCITTHK